MPWMLIITSCLFFVGCANLGQESFNKINPGMNKEEVKKILGAPDDRTFEDKEENWYYQGDAKIVVFEEGKVSALIKDENPVIVNHVTTTEQQIMCKNGLDCSQGFCKDRGDGVSMCMNDGQKGYFCNSSIDCAAGLFCREVGRNKICKE